MKKLISILLCICMIAAFATAETIEEIKASAQEKFQTEAATALKPVESSMATVTSVLSKYSGSNAIQHNIWDDAYIGKVFPSLIPHLGVGVTTAVTIVPIDGLDALIDSLDLGDAGETLKKVGFPLPSANANARIGGVILPFDVGVSYMTLTADADSEKAGMSVNYTSFGVDVRYAVLEQGVIYPNISVGVGYTKSMGAISIGAKQEIEGNTASGAVTSSFDTNVFTGSVQVSKSLLGLLIPYIGASASYVTGTYDWSTQLTGQASVTNPATNETETIDLEYKNGASIEPETSVDVKVYAGLGLKLLVFDTVIGANYDITNGSVGGSLSLRIKL